MGFCGTGEAVSRDPEGDRTRLIKGCAAFAQEGILIESLEGIREVECPYWIRQIKSCAWLVTVLGLFGWICRLDGLAPLS